MKRLLCILAALLLLTPLLSYAEESSLWLEGKYVFAAEDGTLVFHLLVGKTGPGACAITDASIQFYDENNAVVPMSSLELVCAPLSTIPSGDHLVPLTFVATPPEGVTVTSYQLLGINVEEADTCNVSLVEEHPGFMLTQGEEHMLLTSYISAEPDTLPNQYLGYALVYAQDGAYLGCIEIPLGSGSRVTGSDMPAALAAQTGMTEDEQTVNGFVFSTEEASVLFAPAAASLIAPGEVPASMDLYVYRCLPEAPKSLEIVSFGLDAFEDGTFVIHGLLQNTTGDYQRLTGISSVALQNAAGETRLCTTPRLDTPFQVITPGEMVPFTITGQIDPGFQAEAYEAAACGFATRNEPADAPDHITVAGDTQTSFTKGVMTCQATIPLDEGTEAADYYTATICYDAETGNIFDCTWTQPGEGVLTNGAVVLPKTEIHLNLAERSAAVLHIYYRLP